MTKLSDTQLVILSAACQRDARLVLPLPDRLKGGAAARVITSLIAKGLVKEIRAKLDQPVWHETDDDKRITLVATDAAFEALGIAPDDAPAGTDREPAKQGAKTSKPAPAAPKAPATRDPRGEQAGTPHRDAEAARRCHDLRGGRSA